jgi:hypothetical protein
MKKQIIIPKEIIQEFTQLLMIGEQDVHFLALDHINNDGNKSRAKYGSGLSYFYMLKRKNFPPGYQILCHNCNLAKAFYGTCPHSLLKLKSGKLLKSFINFYYFHPELRFWQALAGWSGYNFIYGSKAPEHEINPNLEDTFYKEDEK